MSEASKDFQGMHDLLNIHSEIGMTLGMLLRSGKQPASSHLHGQRSRLTDDGPGGGGGGGGGGSSANLMLLAAFVTES